MTTNTHYSPWDLLPAPEPCTVSPPADYFYNNVSKHLVKDTVRIMNNGLPIDLDRVRELELDLDTTLSRVANDLAAHPYVQDYLKQRHKTVITNYIEDRKSHLKPVHSFIKPFKHSDMNHRSYFMHIYAQQQSLSEPTDLLPTGVPKWPANTVKKLSTTRPLLVRLLEGKLLQNNPLVTQAMQLLAEHKAELHNRKYLDQIATPDVEIPAFNPGSSQQVGELFNMLGYNSDKKSKLTNAESWNREQVEQTGRESSDPLVHSLVQSLVDYSFGAIIKSTFIPAFYKYTINGRLHGQYVLFGAKSFRYTSKQPNLLNAPSTRSIYAKPVKNCFTAPPGFVVYAIDLSALEDRVMASLSRDKNKCDIFLQGLDGHSLNAYGYFPNEVAKYMTVTGDTVTDVKNFFNLQENGNKDLKNLRQQGKPATLTHKRLYTVMCIENYIYAGNSQL